MIPEPEWPKADGEAWEADRRPSWKRQIKRELVIRKRRMALMLLLALGIFGASCWLLFQRADAKVSAHGLTPDPWAGSE